MQTFVSRPTLGQRGAMPPPSLSPLKKKKLKYKKLRFALKYIYIYIYIYFVSPIKYLDIDLQEKK